MVIYTHGNIFSVSATIAVNTVNCVGVMGAGVALEFKRRYPGMFKRYVSQCRKKQYVPGIPQIDDQCEGITIINFPTKNNWRNPSEYRYIQNGLIWLKRYLKDKPDAIVSLPPLGCGCGGLKWQIVKSMIEKELDDLCCLIVVLEPFRR